MAAPATAYSVGNSVFTYFVKRPTARLLNEAILHKKPFVYIKANRYKGPLFSVTDKYLSTATDASKS